MNNIELKDFVSETLKQIIDGIEIAQQYAIGKKATINPWGVSQMNGVSYITPTGNTKGVQFVDFDVSLTASQNNEATGGIGIFISYVGIGGQVKKGTENSAINRIKFSIPVKFPGYNGI